MRNLTATLTVVCNAPDAVFKREGEGHYGVPCEGYKVDMGECCYYEDDNCEYFIDHWWSSLKETTQYTD